MVYLHITPNIHRLLVVVIIVLGTDTILLLVEVYLIRLMVTVQLLLVVPVTAPVELVQLLVEVVITSLVTIIQLYQTDFVTYQNLVHLLVRGYVIYHVVVHL